MRLSGAFMVSIFIQDVLSRHIHVNLQFMLLLFALKLNLTAILTGVQYHVEKRLFLYEKKKYEQSRKLQRESEHVSNCKTFASKSMRALV